MDNLRQSNTGSQGEPRHRGIDVTTSAALGKVFYRGSAPHHRPHRAAQVNVNRGLDSDELQAILRGEAQVHVAQIDQELPLDPHRLLKLSWLAAELASRIEGRP